MGAPAAFDPKADLSNEPVVRCNKRVLRAWQGGWL